MWFVSGRETLGIEAYTNRLLIRLPFSVYASAGTEQRAPQCCRCQNANDFISSTFEFEPQICVLVLTPEHGANTPPFGFGMQHYPRADAGVEGQDNGFWKSMSPTAELRRSGKARKDAYGKPRLVTSAFFDLLAVMSWDTFQFQAKCHSRRLWLANYLNLCLQRLTLPSRPSN